MTITKRKELESYFSKEDIKQLEKCEKILYHTYVINKNKSSHYIKKEIGELWISLHDALYTFDFQAPDDFKENK